MNESVSASGTVSRVRGGWIRVAMGAAILACGAAKNPMTHPASLSSRSEISAQQQVETAIRDWFAFLAQTDPAPAQMGALLSSPTLELSLVDATLRNGDEVMAWVSRLHASFPRIEYETGAIVVEPAESDVYRARFEVDRHAWDPEGLPHVARREQTWSIRLASRTPPVLLTITERVVPYYPGTGPQMVCF